MCALYLKQLRNILECYLVVPCFNFVGINSFIVNLEGDILKAETSLAHINSSLNLSTPDKVILCFE